MERRKSLDYMIWVDHSISLSIAGKENLKLFQKQMNLKSSEKDRNTMLGLFNSTNLIYAASIETMVKAYVLFKELDKIESNKIQNFRQLRKKWSGNGHNIFDIMKLYDVCFSSEEKDVLINLEPFMSWAGRFPFPLHDEHIKKYETQEKNLKLNANKILIAENFLSRLQKEMNLSIK
ncbi:hypothetical protein NBT05_14495 [Aquimarina sp. ERC-38]|uniref:hypothetical protein n=1 Tax=Aquimarina sp. ERC-38 TaxID=2949996 RepID=UPI0022466D99|nr:hypothetical protein [Aquimarina sp. ERC-38]UZO80152.1 hypothetical protein NBT05_14495 [Aquimarina sp. ERC-38]